jgi:hypothetical protein
VRHRARLPPGRYFVRGRDPHFLLEGQVTLAAGDDRTVDESELERIEYARLVRKGRLGHTVSLALGSTVRQSVIDGAGLCLGGFAGAAVDLPVASVGIRVGACHGTFTNAFLDAATDEISTELRAWHTVDVGAVGLGFGVTAGGTLLVESFSTATPTRRTLGGFAGAGVGLSHGLGDGFFLALEGDLLTYFFSAADGGAARISMRAAIFVGKQL